MAGEIGDGHFAAIRDGHGLPGVDGHITGHPGGVAAGFGTDGAGLEAIERHAGCRSLAA